MTTEKEILQPVSAKEVVMAFVNAINKEDFEEARKYVNHDITFDGVLASRIGSYDYFKDMEQTKRKYDVKKIFEDKDDVCLWYNLDMSGATMVGSAWYHLKDGKISTLKVVFDPRPVLELQE